MIINGFSASPVTQPFSQGELVYSSNFYITSNQTGLSQTVTSGYYAVPTNTFSYPTVPILDWFNRFNSLYFRLQVNTSLSCTMSGTVSCRNLSTAQTFHCFLLLAGNESGLDGIYESTNGPGNDNVSSPTLYMNNTSTIRQTASSWTNTNFTCSFSPGYVYYRQNDITGLKGYGGSCWAYKLGRTCYNVGGTQDMLNAINIIKTQDGGTAGSGIICTRYREGQTIPLYNFVSINTWIYWCDANTNGSGWGSNYNSSTWFNTASVINLSIPVTLTVYGYY